MRLEAALTSASPHGTESVLALAGSSAPDAERRRPLSPPPCARVQDGLRAAFHCQEFRERRDESKPPCLASYDPPGNTTSKQLTKCDPPGKEGYKSYIMAEERTVAGRTSYTVLPKEKQEKPPELAGKKKTWKPNHVIKVGTGPSAKWFYNKENVTGKFALSSMKEMSYAESKEAAVGLDNHLQLKSQQRANLERDAIKAIIEEVYNCRSFQGMSGLWKEEDCNTVIECLQYVLYERAGTSERTFKNGNLQVRRDTATKKGPGRRNGETLQQFKEKPQAVDAKLDLTETCALRLYTTAAFRAMNNPLRDSRPAWPPFNSDGPPLPSAEGPAKPPHASAKVAPADIAPPMTAEEKAKAKAKKAIERRWLGPFPGCTASNIAHWYDGTSKECNEKLDPSKLAEDVKKAAAAAKEAKDAAEKAEDLEVQAQLQAVADAAAEAKADAEATAAACDAPFWCNMKPPHPLPATVLACASGIKKLRAVHAEEEKTRNNRKDSPVFSKVGDKHLLDETRFQEETDDAKAVPGSLKECIEVELYFDNDSGTKTEGYDVYECISAPSHVDKKTPIKIFVRDARGELKKDAKGHEVKMKEHKQYKFVNARLPEANNLVLWRGMKDMQFDENFFRNGGADMAFVSTTRDLSIAVQYASGGTSCLILKLSAPNFMDRGADLTFLSAFPEEVEFLYPPLTALKVKEHADAKVDKAVTAEEITSHTREFKLKDIFFSPPPPPTPSMQELSEEKRAPFARSLSAPSRLAMKGSSSRILAERRSSEEKQKSQWWFDMGYYQSPHFHRECERVDGKTLLEYLEYGKQVRKPVDQAGEDTIEVTEYIKKPEMGGAKFQTSSEYTKTGLKKLEYVMKDGKPMERPKRDENGRPVPVMTEDGLDTVKGADGKPVLQMEKVAKIEWPVTKDTWVRMNGDSQWRKLDDPSYISFFGSELLRGAMERGAANKQAALDLDGDGKISIEEQQELAENQPFVKVLELEVRMGS